MSSMQIYYIYLNYFYYQTESHVTKKLLSNSIVNPTEANSAKTKQVCYVKMKYICKYFDDNRGF